ncbi:MAG: hypothetical protein JOY54_19875 [Acidobacteriaceae bacterium]|nr:hypothetical protein [Acidobacteriaceae bacterium]
MATIKVSDHSGLAFAAGNANSKSALNKYLQSGLELLFRDASFQFKAVQNVPLKELPPHAFPLALSVTVPGNFAVSRAALNVESGATASLDLLAGEKAQDFCAALHLDRPPLTDLLSFAFSGELAGGPAGTVGDFSFGLTSGTELIVTNYSPSAETDLFLDAATRAISGLEIPHALDDLENMAENSFCSIEGKGSLKFTASVQYNFLNNTLASQPLELISQSLSVKAQSGAKLQVAVEQTSSHQLTIAALPGRRFRLGVALGATEDVAASLTWSLGVSATVGGQDPLDFLVQHISPSPESELDKLRASLPSDAQKELSEQIKKVLEGALDGGIKASLQAALEKSRETRRLFVYEVDLNALDRAGTQAVQAALQGDFTPITAQGTNLAGIREIDNTLTITLATTRSLTIHLIGILNFNDVSSFIAKSKPALNQDAGEVVLTAEEIKVVENNLDPDHLREVQLRSAMITSAAVASPRSPSFSFKLVFFLRKAQPGRSDLLQFVNVLRAVGSPDLRSAQELLTGSEKHGGGAAIYLSLNLDKALSLLLFEHPNSDDYVLAGQNAMRMILSGDDSARGRLPLFSVDLSFWKQLRDAGTGQNILALLRARGITDQAALVDFYSVDWWAQAMGKVALALNQHKSLRDAQADALKKSQGGFDVPWAVLATHWLVGQAAVTSTFTVNRGQAIAAGGGSGATYTG